MRIVVFGAANVDIMTRSISRIIPGDSNPAEVTLEAGGVGRNIAANLARLGAQVDFITAIGSDPLGRFLRDCCEACGVQATSWIVREGASTGVYSAALDCDGELYAGFNSMSVTESISPADLAPYRTMIGGADLLVTEANLTEEALRAILDMRGNTPVLVDAVSAVKARRLTHLLAQIDILKLNRIEAQQLTGLPLDSARGLEHACSNLLAAGVGRVFITLGAQGACAADKSGYIFAPAEHIDVANVTGAGDAFTAGAALRLNGPLAAQLEHGLQQAAIHLSS